MESAILYLIERGLLIAAIAGLAGYAIYQWKVGKVKPQLIAEFQAEAETKARANMAAEIEEYEAAAENMTQRIYQAQAWVDARKYEALEITEPLYDDIAKAQSEYNKLQSVCRSVQSIVKLIDGLSQHKHFMDTITKAKKSRMQSTAREAKAEIKALTRDVSDMQICANKIEKYLKTSEWRGKEPPKVREQESDNETVD